jgi:hypothetical protein
MIAFNVSSIWSLLFLPAIAGLALAKMATPAAAMTERRVVKATGWFIDLFLEN